VTTPTSAAMARSLRAESRCNSCTIRSRRLTIPDGAVIIDSVERIGIPRQHPAPRRASTSPKRGDHRALGATLHESFAAGVA
jgi:hypothetical protein